MLASIRDVCPFLRIIFGREYLISPANCSVCVCVCACACSFITLLKGVIMLLFL